MYEVANAQIIHTETYAGMKNPFKDLRWNFLRVLNTPLPEIVKVNSFICYVSASVNLLCQFWLLVVMNRSVVILDFLLANCTLYGKQYPVKVEWAYCQPCL